jgi:uncharacterized membrane protein HdeD (DUF308 family)
MFKSSKSNLILRGILFIALGILCFCFPEAIFNSAAIAVGVVIMLVGIVLFVLQYRKLALSLDTMRLSATVLMVALGALIVVRTDIVAILLGIFVLFEGIDFTLNSLKYRKAQSKGWWLMLLLGLVVVALGCWGIFSPDDQKRLVSITVGIAFVGIGIASFIALMGLELVEDYFDSVRRSIEEKDEDIVEAEVVK